VLQQQLSGSIQEASKAQKELLVQRVRQVLHLLGHLIKVIVCIEFTPVQLGCIGVYLCMPISVSLI